MTTLLLLVAILVNVILAAPLAPETEDLQAAGQHFGGFGHHRFHHGGFGHHGFGHHGFGHHGFGHRHLGLGFRPFGVPGFF